MALFDGFLSICTVQEVLWALRIAYFFDFLGNNQLRIVRDDFRDMIINQMNVIPKNQNF
jgi:hypothetical protein